LVSPKIFIRMRASANGGSIRTAARFHVKARAAPG
jgi:hypothetical protein